MVNNACIWETTISYTHFPCEENSTSEQLYPLLVINQWNESPSFICQAYEGGRGGGAAMGVGSTVL